MISPTLEPIDDVTVVAIDGPAGSGKSSVSKQVARRLGFGYLDTGAAYRALAWHALEHGADTSDSTSVLDVAGDFDYAISLDPDDYWVRVGSTDVTDAIREPRVTDAVSGVARVPAVRRTLGALFRSLVADSDRAGVVVEGRDITTVVAPDAPVRILLTAAPSVRAARRSAELTGHDADTVADALHRRDAQDSTVVDFLTAAPGVQVVDSTRTSISNRPWMPCSTSSTRSYPHRQEREMSADDEYEGGDDKIAEAMADLDEELAEARAETLRASLSDYELDDEDAELLVGRHARRRRHLVLSGAAGGRDRGSPERRQVRAREPHPRSPRGGRRGHPGCHA